MKISGTVHWVGGGLAKGAQVKLMSSDEIEADTFDETKEDGKFEFDNVAAGDWLLAVRHLEGLQTDPEPVTVSGTEDVTGVRLSIASYSGTIDMNAGKNFLCFLLGMLFLLITTWFIWFAGANTDGDAAELLYLNEKVARTAEALKSAEDDAAKTEGWAATQEELADLYRAMLSRLQSRDISVKDDFARKKLADGIGELNRNLAAATPEDAAAIDTQIVKVEAKYRELSGRLPEIARGDLKRGRGVFDGMDWMVGQNLSLTVLFWAVIGTIVRLIMVVQYYLFKSAFWRQGLYQHFSLLFAVPVLVFAMVKLLSLITITAAEDGDGETLSLDFSDPQIMAIGAFLLSLGPWRLWTRLLSISRRVGSK